MKTKVRLNQAKSTNIIMGKMKAAKTGKDVADPQCEFKFQAY